MIRIFKNMVSSRIKDQSWPRPLVQIIFILVSLLIGLQFHNFVKALSSEAAVDISMRPPAVDAYLPISSLMSLVYFIKTGEANLVHPAGLVIFTLTLVLCLLLNRGFCSWVCPFGAAEEWIYKFGQTIFKRRFKMPRVFDYILRSLKYLLLAFFLYTILTMPVEGMRAFIHAPYNRIADLKMYVFFQNITYVGIGFVLFVGVLSVFFANFWCRYLCPYGALLGIFAGFSLTVVKRNKEKCSGCGKCSKVCLNSVDMANRIHSRSAECTACMDCVRACGKQNALQVCAGSSKVRLSYLGYAVLILSAFYMSAKIAESANYWQTDTPGHLYKTLYKQIEQVSHP